MGELVTLKNGMRFYADPMPRLESAAIGVWAKAGAVDEAPEENGVAHLLEHMAFKGTSRRTAKQISEEIESVGGYLNAATSYQRTGYYARVLKDDVALAVDILGDILTDPSIDAGELTKEKEVVVQEIGEAFDTPDDAVGEMLQAAAFAGQPLGRPILGSVASVRSHDPARLRGFMRRLYASGNLVAVAAGAIDPEKVAALLEEAFAGAASGGPAAERATPRYVGGAAQDERDIEQTHIAIAFAGVGALDDDFFPTRVFAEALGGGMASRLFQTIREERGLAYSIFSYADSYDRVGVVGAYVGTEAGQANEAVALIRAGIAAMAEDFSDRELSRARAVLKSSLLMGLESPAGRMESAAGQILTFGTPLAPEFVAARIDAVSLDDVRRCAVRALEAATPSLAVVGPADFANLRAAIGAAA